MSFIPVCSNAVSRGLPGEMLGSLRRSVIVVKWVLVGLGSNWVLGELRRGFGEKCEKNLWGCVSDWEMGLGFLIGWSKGSVERQTRRPVWEERRFMVVAAGVSMTGFFSTQE